ncbi:MAG: hypothetical protein Q8Q09_17065 [Deltaproteobacteria bacterium]|nr:hypothetical protein [Deltaproteobacteria bacterium]
MDPDTTLAHLLRLRGAIDLCIETGVPVGDDDVYLLVGLLDEMDRWMVLGRAAPRRWRRALQPLAIAARVPRVCTLDLRTSAANDNAQGRRRPRSRRTQMPTQLALAL